MILNDASLKAWGRHCVVPYEEELVNPASMDLRLSGEYIDLATGERRHISIKGFTLQPGMAILASTKEYIVLPEDCAGTLYLKSSLARQGLDHALAGWIDPGFMGQLTLELHAHRPIVLQYNQRICQIVLQRMENPPEKSYRITGRYNGQRGPTEAKK